MKFQDFLSVVFYDFGVFSMRIFIGGIAFYGYVF